MIRVLFFARIREQLGMSTLELSEMPGATVRDVRQKLLDQHGPQWQEVLCADNVITALNQDVVGLDAMVSAGDELAFFPPVTGG